MIESPLEWLLLVLAVFGGVDLAARGLGVLAGTFPVLLSTQRKVWRLLGDAVAIPVLRRKAVGARVEEVVNQAAFQLQQYLPKGWLRRARIRWVRAGKAPQLRDGDLVLRMRPSTDHDRTGVSP